MVFKIVLRLFVAKLTRVRDARPTPRRGLPFSRAAAYDAGRELH